MSDAFLPGNGFDTYETQDKVLVSMDGTVDCGVVVRILQQQGFGVAGAVVQLAADQSAWAAAARQAAEALGIECIVLKAEALADQPAEVLGALLPDFTAEELGQCIADAYGEQWSDERITPLKPLGDDYVLELFNGPTSAFKDVAPQGQPQAVSAVQPPDPSPFPPARLANDC